MLSSSAEISIDLGLFLVPLKQRCSKKWESPFISLVSYSEPASTKTRIVVARFPGWGTVIIRRPFSRIVFVNFISSLPGNRLVLQFLLFFAPSYLDPEQ